MSAEIEAYIEQLDYLRGEVKQALDSLQPEELDQAPLPSDTNSPGVLVTHMAGSESFWVHQVAGGMDVERDRDAEFRSAGASAADLAATLDRTGDKTRQVLRGLSGDDLDRTAQARPGEPPVTTRYAVLHALEHMAQHVGQLALTVQVLHAQEGRPLP